MIVSPINLFTGFFQLAYVTTDFDHAVEVFRSRNGVPGFLDLGPGSRTLDDGRVMTIRVGLCFVGDTQIEIVQPIDGAVELYRGLLPPAGFALTFHHLGFRARSADELARIRLELEVRGYQIVLSCNQGVTSSFFYADARATLGHYLEYLVLHSSSEEVWADVPRY